MKVIKGFEELLAAMQPEQLEGLLATMQQVLEKKKQEPKGGAFPFPQHRERLEKAQEEMGALLKAFVAEGAVAASIIMNCTAFDGKGTSAGLCIFRSLDDLNEDGLSAALDVFVNPRRITILKLLIPANMTASEISKKTGLVGGQLYHHLECLINAGLIEKRGDTYRTKGHTQALLCGLNAAVGGMDIASMKDEFQSETSNANPDNPITNFISGEHPQTIALILSYLQPEQAAKILCGLPSEKQDDVAARMKKMESAGS